MCIYVKNITSFCFFFCNRILGHSLKLNVGKFKTNERMYFTQQPHLFSQVLVWFPFLSNSNTRRFPKYTTKKFVQKAIVCLMFVKYTPEEDCLRRDGGDDFVCLKDHGIWEDFEKQLFLYSMHVLPLHGFLSISNLRFIKGAFAGLCGIDNLAFGSHIPSSNYTHETAV